MCRDTTSRALLQECYHGYLLGMLPCAWLLRNDIMVTEERYHGYQLMQSWYQQRCQGHQGIVKTNYDNLS